MSSQLKRNRTSTAPARLKPALKAVDRIVADSWPRSAKSTWKSHLQLEDFDAVPVVPQLLLQLGDGLLQRPDLLLPLLVLVQPVGNLVRAAKHVRALLLVQLGQRGHQPAHAVLHHLEDGGEFMENNFISSTCQNSS